MKTTTKPFDLKELYQIKAEELAGDVDFFSLSDEEQLRLYNKAVEITHEKLMAMAEYREDIRREAQMNEKEG